MTKRELQRLINNECENRWKNILEAFKAVKADEKINKLDNCKAGYIQANGCTFLISYRTLVAAIDEDGVMVDMLRSVYGYTVTSAKHISKLRNRFYHVDEITWREV